MCRGRMCVEVNGMEVADLEPGRCAAATGLPAACGKGCIAISKRAEPRAPWSGLRARATSFLHA